jgi:hypothetical protein
LKLFQKWWGEGRKKMGRSELKNDIFDLL